MIYLYSLIVDTCLLKALENYLFPEQKEQRTNLKRLTTVNSLTNGCVLAYARFRIYKTICIG